MVPDPLAGFISLPPLPSPPLFFSSFITKVANMKRNEVRQPWYGELFCFNTKIRALEKFLDFTAFFFLLFVCFFAAPHGLWDLNSTTRD